MLSLKQGRVLGLTSRLYFIVLEGGKMFFLSDSILALEISISPRSLDLASDKGKVHHPTIKRASRWKVHHQQLFGFSV